MSETKFTPGPWSVERVEYGEVVTDDLCILAPSPSFRPIATIERCYNGDRDKDMEAAHAALIAAAPELFSELLDAHQIIRNALNIMTIEQKSEWARRNDADGVIGEGVTRANEREAVIAKVIGGAK